VAKKVEAQLADIREEAKAKGANLNARRNTKTGF
jgi:5-(carboxyamino)imidazole ribonucleotide mutase